MSHISIWTMWVRVPVAVFFCTSVTVDIFEKLPLHANCDERLLNYTGRGVTTCKSIIVLIPLHRRVTLSNGVCMRRLKRDRYFPIV